MLTIHKFPIGRHTSLTLPKMSDVLAVGCQGGQVMLWICVDTDPEVDQVARHFVLFATGEPLPADIGSTYIYVGTVQTPDGFVWHVFESE